MIRKKDNPYSKLARIAVENYLKTGKKIEPPQDLPKDFYQEKKGVFVTIYNGKELRGCIGTFLATKENIAKEIIENAIAAATKDYRFAKIREDELMDLSYEISLLDKPKLIKDLKELDVKKYGILVRSLDGKSGLLLPDLEGVDTVDKQISIACQKGGIDLNQESLEIFRFSVKKFS
jgi:AmmeMemoRadiSam system protein A